MALKIIKGDLFDPSNNIDIIAHSVNCRGAFGSGVAGQIAQLYPGVRQAYLSKFENRGWKLGDVQYNFTYDGTVIVNMATQDDFGTYKVQVDYNAVKDCLEQVFCWAYREHGNIGLPWVGCGLAGGDKKVVLDIITKLLMKYDVDVTIYEKD